jgi:hypothetical protein
MGEKVSSSGSYSVLLNGVPGKSFHYKRGVRQGDPLSPLLFVQGADLLQSLVNFSFQHSLLTRPIPVGEDFPIIQYADDIIIVLHANVSQLMVFKSLLNHYASFTGLKVNYHKSSMIPINVPHDKAMLLSQAFQCHLGAMPFTYLGLPMGTTKPTIKDLSPLIDRIERILSTTSSFLSYGDKLVLVNFVLSSLPTHFMLSLNLPVGILDVIDRATRHCLWRKKDKNKVQALPAWDMICKTKNKGGLGILNLSIQNTTLLLKHLHKFYNHDSTPWVQLIWDSYYYDVVPHVVTFSRSFWWKNIMKLSDQYRVLTKCEVGNESSVLFWSDLWKD